jgi:hypothetical protein
MLLEDSRMTDAMRRGDLHARTNGATTPVAHAATAVDGIDILRSDDAVDAGYNDSDDGGHGNRSPETKRTNDDKDDTDSSTVHVFDLAKFRRVLRRQRQRGQRQWRRRCVPVIRHGDVAPLLLVLLPLAPPPAQEAVLDAFKWLLSDASSPSSLLSDPDIWAAQSN